MATKSRDGQAGKACQNTVKKKTYDKAKAKIWGSPDYLKMRFDDVVDVHELSRRCVDTRRVKDIVKGISTPKDGLGVHRVYRTDLRGPDGRPAGSSVVVDISFGLNGLGRQSDYLAALKRLIDTNAFSIFDCYVDAVDDVASVLCSYEPVHRTVSVKGKGA